MTTLDGDNVFMLKFLEARDPDWVRRIFFAVTWSGGCAHRDGRPRHPVCQEVLRP